MLLGKFTLRYILLAGTSFVLAGHNLNFKLSSKLCFHIIKPFRENLRVHYDRNYLLNGGVPDDLKGGLYFQGPHKVSVKSHFRLVVRDLTMGGLLDRSYLYIFFHKDLVFSGCLHNELKRKKFTQIEGPGVPYDITHGNHGVPSELWRRKFNYDKKTNEATLDFQINTNKKCPYGVFGAIFMCNSTVFHNGKVQGMGKVQCFKGNYFRSYKSNKIVHFHI